MSDDKPDFAKRLAGLIGIVVVIAATVLAAITAAGGDYGSAVAVQVVGLLIAGGILLVFRLSE
jgi:uncharacterized membrane protein